MLLISHLPRTLKHWISWYCAQIQNLHASPISENVLQIKFKVFNFAAFYPNILLFASCTCPTLSYPCLFASHSPTHFGIPPPPILCLSRHVLQSLTWLLLKRHLKSCLQPWCARCSRAPLALTGPPLFLSSPLGCALFLSSPLGCDLTAGKGLGCTDSCFIPRICSHFS